MSLRQNWGIGLLLQWEILYEARTYSNNKANSEVEWLWS